MKKRAILSLVCIAITTILSGCNNPKAANKENFAKVLSQYVAKNPDVVAAYARSCKINTLEVPKEVPSPVGSINDYNKNSVDYNKSYEVLKNAGILTSQFVREEDRPYQGRLTITKYELSEKGKQIAKEIYGSGLFDLPYCKVAFKEVKLFTEPTDSSAGKISQVDYTFVIEKIDDWANNPEILQVYPKVKEALDSVGKPIDAKKALVLTSEGWSTGEK